MKRPILPWNGLLKYNITLEIQNRTIAAMEKLEPTQIPALTEMLHQPGQPTHKKLHHYVIHESLIQQ
jgi:hypothetical protein